MLLSTALIHAQVNVEVSAGVVPPWAPAEAVGVRYYYIPDIEAYYDVNTATYIYLSNGEWVHTRTLPPAYANYDLWSGYKVVLNDYHGERPYDDYKVHVKKYPRGYNHGHLQKTYGKRPEHKDDEHR